MGLSPSVTATVPTSGGRSALAVHGTLYRWWQAKYPQGIWAYQNSCKALQCLATSKGKRTRQTRHCNANDRYRTRSISAPTAAPLCPAPDIGGGRVLQESQTLHLLLIALAYRPGGQLRPWMSTVAVVLARCRRCFTVAVFMRPSVARNAARARTRRSLGPSAPAAQQDRRHHGDLHRSALGSNPRRTKEARAVARRVRACQMPLAATTARSWPSSQCKWSHRSVAVPRPLGRRIIVPMVISTAHMTARMSSSCVSSWARTPPPLVAIITEGTPVTKMPIATPASRVRWPSGSAGGVGSFRDTTARLASAWAAICWSTRSATCLSTRSRNDSNDCVTVTAVTVGCWCRSSGYGCVEMRLPRS